MTITLLAPTLLLVNKFFFNFMVITDLQSKTKLQSSAMESIKLVVKDIKNWWVKKGIPKKKKNNQAIEKMTLHDVDEYKLRKNRNRKSKLEETKREQFLSKSEKTFWAVQPNYELQLKKWQQKDKSDKRHEEDWLY